MLSYLKSVLERPLADPIVSHHGLLAASAWPPTLLMVVYLLVVLKLGRIYMAHREPYNIKNILLAYNIFQMIFNAILFSCLLNAVLINPLSDIRCMEILPLDHPRKYIDRWISYVFYVNKILDLLETVFFVLRKSYKQISFLHVYHHCVMVYTMYWIIRLNGVGGQYNVMMLMNTFIHTVMYFYYFITAMYPELRGNLWWKKYITLLQIIQFLILITQSTLMLTLNPECKFSLFMQYMQLFQGSCMLYLFSNFYYKAYIKPKKLKK